MRKFLNVILCIVLALVVIAAAYFAYLMLSYHRIGDQTLAVEEGAQNALQTDTDYTLLSWNIGFGAYEDDYGFFMDGGTESWAWSEERLRANLAQIAARIQEQEPDLLLLQEVDSNSTRTYHVNELELLQSALQDTDLSNVYACNYDSPFLFYPFHQPHGKSVSGIWTAVQGKITAANRVSLPVETGLTKFLDLDRCYSVSRIPLENGKELCLYNFHLSAYTSDGKIADEQLELLLADMQREYEAGNYAIAGGDFNKDLPEGGSEQYFGVSTEGHNWAQPIRRASFEDTDLTLVPPLDPDDPVASCRYADGPIRVGQLMVNVDGFIVSDNVEVTDKAVIDTGFENSDHNPVRLQFRLTEAG